MARAPWIVIIAIVVCIFIGVQVYDNKMVPTIKKIQVVCDDPKHQGDQVITTDEKPTIAKRKDARHKIVEVQQITCPTCQKRQEQELRIAKEKAEAETLLRQLDYQFALGYMAMEGWIRERSLRPGEKIQFCLEVTNKGPSVIEDIKIVIQPANYLYLTPFREDSMFDRAMHDVHVSYDKEDTALLRSLTTTGLPVRDFQGKDKLFPRGNPYYPENKGYFSTLSMFRYRLALSPKLQPGQDIQFQGYLVYKGHKIPIGALTVHVMYGDTQESVNQSHSGDTSSSLCQQNLSQARIAVQMFSVSNNRYPSSLKELVQSKPGLILRCDIDKQSYSYDPKNGRLGCTHQDHKRY